MLITVCTRLGRRCPPRYPIDPVREGSSVCVRTCRRHGDGWAFLDHIYPQLRAWKVRCACLDSRLAERTNNVMWLIPNLTQNLRVAALRSVACDEQPYSHHNDPCVHLPTSPPQISGKQPDQKPPPNTLLPSQNPLIRLTKQPRRSPHEQMHERPYCRKSLRPLTCLAMKHVPY